jgi:hypothetical protein
MPKWIADKQQPIEKIRQAKAELEAKAAAEPNTNRKRFSRRLSSSAGPQQRSLLALRTGPVNKILKTWI